MFNNSNNSFFGRAKKESDDYQTDEKSMIETETITENLRKSKIEIENLRNQLMSYQEKEQLVSQILINAQLNAHRIELEARQHARLLLEKCSMDLKEKKKELDRLRSNVSRLRKQYREIFSPGPPAGATPESAGDS